jgi:hypothetical protein
MKQFLTALCVIMLVASFVSAQEVTGVGPKVQLNMANVAGDNSSDNKMALLFGAGGFLTMSVVPELDLQAEVIYNMKGTKGDPDWSYTLSYIEANLLAKYPIVIEGSDIKPTVFAGPTLGVLVSASADPGGVDIKDNLETLEYGLIFGAGATIPIEDGALVVDARFNLGLANLLKVGGSVYSNTNQVISLSVGYAFKP